MAEETIERAPKVLGTMLDYLGLEASVKAQEKNGAIILTVYSEDAGRIIGKKGIALHSLQLLLNRVMSKGDKESPRIMIDVDGYRKAGRGPRRERSESEGGESERSEGIEGGERSDRGDRRDRRERRGRGDHDRRRTRHSPEGRERSPEGSYQSSSSSQDKEEQIKQKALDAAKEVKRWGEPVTLPPMSPRDRRIVHLALEGNPDITSESLGADDGNDTFKSIVLKLNQQ